QVHLHRRGNRNGSPVCRRVLIAGRRDTGALPNTRPRCAYSPASAGLSRAASFVMTMTLRTLCLLVYLVAALRSAAGTLTTKTGQLRADRTARHTIILNADDGARLWVGGKLLIDRWYDQPAQDITIDVQLEKDRKVDLRLELYNGQAGAQATLSWKATDLPREV